jgi:small subunit ribosomal protein S20
MPNLKASIKSVKKTAKKTTRNRIIISTLKYNTKKARNSSDKKDLNNLYKKADSALAKGKIHKNKANRIKSRIAKANNKNGKTSS